MKLIIATTLVALTSVTGACVSFGGHKPASAVTPDQRLAILRRCQVWTPTRVAAMNMAAGPQGPGSFTRDQNVTCTWVERKLTGNSPKFACVIDGSNNDEVKVKLCVTNAEVYSEVAATRLFWALGFGSDRMYPVRVICHGCPADFDVPGEKPVAERVFDPAVIDGGELIVYSEVVKDRPVTRNFGGFSLSVPALLKKARDAEKLKTP